MSVTNYSNELTGNIWIDALTDGAGSKWGGVFGTSADVSYSFPWTTNISATWSAEYSSTQEPYAAITSGLNSAQQVYARDIFNIYESFANINFNEIVDGPSSVGDIRIAFSSKVDEQQGMWGYAYYPDAVYAIGGDIWIGSAYRSDYFTPGAYNYMALMHEVGHALGLKHPFEGSVVLPGSEDNRNNTIMSYTDYKQLTPEFTIDGLAVSANYGVQYAETPMVYDIAALQAIYGANMMDHITDDIYVFGVTDFYKTIWDAGGIDTLDFSTTTHANTVNLIAGTYSRVNYRSVETQIIEEKAYFYSVFQTISPSLDSLINDVYNSRYNSIYTGEKALGIAFGVTIENATGGSGDDSITGNDADNILNGGAGADSLTGAGGNDILNGGSGDDIMHGGSGDDIYYVDEITDVVGENISEGIDTVIILCNYTLGDNIENLTLDAGTIRGSGNALNNTLRASNSGNELKGAGGNDTLYGGSGIDTALYSSIASEYIVNYNIDGSVTVEDTIGGRDGIDTLLDIEQIRFTDKTINANANVNEAPTFGNNLANISLYTENGAASILASSVLVYDAELSTLDNYAGATLTLERSGTSNIQDQFSGSGILAGQASGDVTTASTVIGTYAYVNGSLTITFNTNATQALVDQTLQSIAYNNISDAPPASVQIDWTFNDGNTGSQGDGGALATAGSTTVTITAVNDTPVVSPAAPSIEDGLNSQDTLIWSKSDGWGNGGIFANNWEAGQIAFNNGSMRITLSEVNSTLLSGEYRSNETYGYGYYEVSLKASNILGTINGFFTYTGASEGTQHDEIDIEIKGDDPTKLQVNYWTNGVEHPTVINLGFDASVGMHTYAFRWSTNAIEWYVDGALVHTENGTNGTLPSTAGKIMANLWATQGATGWSSDYTTANGTAELVIDSIAYHSNVIGVAPEDSGSISITQAQLLANASDVDGDTLSVTGLSASAGTLVNNNNGMWTLTPAANYNGTITLSYIVTDGIASVATTATQVVSAVNDAPIASTITVNTNEDTVFTGTLPKATDEDGNTITYSLHTIASHGTASVQSNGNYAYTSKANYHGSDSFTYSVFDGNGGSNTYVIAINVVALNDAPTGSVSIAGIALVNEVLTASNTLADVDGMGVVTYQWFAGGIAIANANQSTYTLTASEIDETITVQASYTDQDGTAESKTSASTTLVGNSGANILDGAGGIDKMIGGTGNDTYYVDNIKDVVIETSTDINEIDTVISSVSYTLSANVENLTLMGTAIKAIGNISNNTLIGNDGDNILDGKTGADTMIGGLGDDTYYIDNTGDTVTENVDEGTDTIISTRDFDLSIDGANVESLTLSGKALVATGNEWDNILIGNTATNALIGNEGDDTLDGKVGADIMIGGLGDDTYYVDNIGDIVIEVVAEGNDTVYAKISHTLTVNVENLILYGTASTKAYGNDLDNIIAGNKGNNLLDGAIGADTMTGGLGNDTYCIDDAGDIVVEDSILITQVDSVISSISYTLGNNVENLALLGGNDIDATGNELNNVLKGNSGDNILNGEAGIDTMAGRTGNDTYYVDNIKDKVTEVSTDINEIDIIFSTVSYTLAANVENLTLTSTAIKATGNKAANEITGNDQDNILNGKEGNDTLAGGSGNDTFVFTTKLSTATVLNVDTVTDFTAGDSIQLENAIFKKLTTITFDATTKILSTDFFAANVTGAAQDTDDYILYNTASGVLSYDADGSGTKFVAIDFAQITGVNTLSASDFTVI